MNTPKFAAAFYAIRNATDKTTRDALIRRYRKLGMPRVHIASAAQISPSTVGKISAA